MGTLSGLPLVGWFSCDYLAEIGTPDGATVTTWPNIARGYEAYPFTGSAVFRANVGGRPAIELTGTQAMAWDPESTDWDAASGSNEGLFVLRRMDTSRGHLQNFGGYFGDVWYPDASGNVVDDFLTASALTFTPTLSVTEWRRYDVWSDGGDKAVLIDETPQASSSGNARSAPSGANGIGDTGGYGLNGWYSAIYLFNEKLTDAERARAVDWSVTYPGGGLPFPTGAPPGRLFPRSDGLGVGSGRHFPPPVSQQRSGRRFGYY